MLLIESVHLMEIFIGIISSLSCAFILFVFRRYILLFYRKILLNFRWKSFYLKYKSSTQENIFNRYKINKNCNYEDFFKYIYIENELVSYNGDANSSTSLSEILKHTQQDIAVIGKHGSGKTLLCLRSMQFFPLNKKICFYVNAIDLYAAEKLDVLDYIRKDFQKKISVQIGEHDFIRILKKFEIVLLIDGLNETTCDIDFHRIQPTIQCFQSQFHCLLVYMHDEAVPLPNKSYRILNLSLTQKYQLIDNLFYSLNQKVEYIQELKELVSTNESYYTAYTITLLYYINQSRDSFLSSSNKLSLIRTYLERIYITERNLTIAELKQKAFSLQFEKGNISKNSFFATEDLFEYCLASQLSEWLIQDYEKNEPYLLCIIEIGKENIIEYILLLISEQYTKIDTAFVNPLLSKITSAATDYDHLFSLSSQLIHPMKKELIFLLFQSLYQNNKNVLYSEFIYYTEAYQVFDIALDFIRQMQQPDVCLCFHLLSTYRLFHCECLENELRSFLKTHSITFHQTMIDKIEKATLSYLKIEKKRLISCSRSFRGHLLLPKFIQSFAESAFFDCSYITSVFLPEGIDRIPYNCFARCVSLLRIDFPQSVISVDDFAFFKCEKLKTVSLNDNLISLGSWSFYWCYQLESISLPISLNYLGSSCFRLCYKLEHFHLPRSLKKVGRSTFANCTSLQISSESSLFVVDKIGVLYDEAKKRILFYPYKRKENEFKIKDSIEEIDSWLFSNNFYLKKVTIPKCIKKIGRNPFECSNIEIVNESPYFELSQGVLYTKGLKDLIYYPTTKKDQKWIAPDETLVILEGAFSHQEYLKEIHLNNTQILREFAFYYCSCLEEIVGKNITKVYSYALDGTKWIQNQPTCVILGSTIYEYKSDDIENFTIPKKISFIADYAFKNNLSLKKISVEKRSCLIDIGANAFTHCAFFQSWRNSNKDAMYIGNVLFRVNTKYKGCFIVSQGCRSIAEIAFRNCSGIEEVVLPEGFHYIGFEAFKNCTSLKKINLSSEIKIDPQAFDASFRVQD